MRCVHCGSPVIGTFVQYSPGNLRLRKCPKCGCVADEYVECEPIIVFVDIVLHKPEAYRHLFFNSNALSSKVVVMAVLLLVVLEACLYDYFSTERAAAISYRSAKMLAKAAVTFSSYITGIWIMHRFFTKKRSSSTSLMDILTAITSSSYFKLFIFAMMIWDFSPHIALVIEVLVLISNGVALQVVLNTSANISMVLVAASAAPTFFWKLFLYYSLWANPQPQL
ncbi:protein arv1 homolog [Selaginella moellendorffii]|uniref:protein arv1 homolog n=1 Tax=Selaginella moellendorffii TaxID=88036 RepID=UPI000D1C3572|nr:protein arv1 homolog [Selaginella moellendorffii]|eukprot:XP_024543965.1 protein arv1 homolog [Selaginella moellendorffii]